MDWYSWLSKTSLNPSLVAEYALLLSRNELDELDIPHFDHAFLHSMGISIAKHRLEILKLSRKQSSSLSRLLAAIRKTKICLTRCLRSLTTPANSSAIIILPRRPWRVAALKRSKKVVVLKKGMLMLTAKPSSESHAASPMVYNFEKSYGEDYEFWKGGDAEEEIRWDSMFHGMKPT